jgi:hypothetical protein
LSMRSTTNEAGFIEAGFIWNHGSRDKLYVL